MVLIVPNLQLYYDRTKELEENIRILNTVLESEYGKSFKIFDLEDYEGHYGSLLEIY